MTTFYRLAGLATLLALSSTTVLAAEIPLISTPPFSMFDSNHDGVISQNEYDNLRGERMGQMAAHGITLSENNQLPMFSQVDRNDDGQLTVSEYTESFPDAPPVAEKQANQTPAKSGTGQSAGNSSNNTSTNEVPTLKQSFRELDLNNDGRVTVFEFDIARSRAQARRGDQGKLLEHHQHHQVTFQDLDLNSDGIVTNDEYRKATGSN